MDGEPLMSPESTGEATAALATFPGIAGVTVVEHGTGPGERHDKAQLNDILREHGGTL